MRLELVLASASASRAALLRQAGGVDFRIIPSRLDEAAIKKSFSGTPEALALALAKAKALAVSPKVKGALVLAADQVLALPDDGAVGWQGFDKPETLAQARAMLEQLRGKTHRLCNGAVLAQDGELLWQHQSSAALTMRFFSDGFLDDYLAREGDALFASVGAYRLEGAGAHLFSAIEGDFFTILGLPLIPLLEALREQKHVAS